MSDDEGPDDKGPLEEKRPEFLIEMYKQLLIDINRHIVVVWQSVGVLFAAFAGLALAEKNILPIDLAISLIILVCGWVLAHVYDAGYWYNRNLVIIANIERQFLRRSDLQAIHYYFGGHRKVGKIITHLRIQRALAVGIGALLLGFHISIVAESQATLCEIAGTKAVLPWITAVSCVGVWIHAHIHAKKRYETFVRNSPGRIIDTTHITHGPGHPV